MIERLPKHASELNRIKRSWRDLKRHPLANRTFRDADHLDRAVHDTLAAINRASTKRMWAHLLKAA